MNLLVVRLGINWEEIYMPKFKDHLEELLPEFKIILLHGENENIETSFEVIELPDSFPAIEKEITIDYLKQTIKAIYACDYNSLEGKHVIYVDPYDLTKEEKKTIDIFCGKNKSVYQFVFQNKNYPCKGF